MNNGYSICLNEWIEDNRIKSELRLLLKISSLTAEKGFCYATNPYFAKYFKVSEVTVSRQVKKLEKLGFIEIEYKKQGALIISRKIKILSSIKKPHQEPKTKPDTTKKAKPTTKTEPKKDNKKNLLKNINKELHKIATHFIEYRKSIGKPLKTDKPLITHINKLKELKENGFNIGKVLELMESKEWLSITLQYIINNDDYILSCRDENCKFTVKSKDDLTKAEQNKMRDVKTVYKAVVEPDEPEQDKDNLIEMVDWI